MDAVPHPHLAERMAAAMVSAMGMNQRPESHVKKKRGRPRRYGPSGMAASSSAPLSIPPIQSNDGEKIISRPPWSSTKQQLGSQGLEGKRVASSVGHGFTPHIITVAAGEDVATKIMSFSQKGPRAVCVLSANGAISNATLQQPAASGGSVTYEGRFEILSLSGSFLLTEIGGTRSRTGGLSISLASPDGHVVGGGVAGLLVAASPVQVVLGSFTTQGYKAVDESGSEVREQLPGQRVEPPVMLSKLSPVAENGRKVIRSTKVSRHLVNQSYGAVRNSLLHRPGQEFLETVEWSDTKFLP